MLDHLKKINNVLFEQVAKGIGEKVEAPPTKGKPKTSKGTSDMPDELTLLENATTPTTASGGVLKAKGLSMEIDQPKLAKGRKVAILVAEGVAVGEITAMQDALLAEKVSSEIIAPHIGEIPGEGGATEATKTYANTSSVHFDAVYIPGGKKSIEMLKMIPDALRFVDEAYKHGKAIAATGAGVELVMAAGTGKLITEADAEKQGVLLDEDAASVSAGFIDAIANHRYHNRQVDKVIA